MALSTRVRRGILGFSAAVAALTTVAAAVVALNPSVIAAAHSEGRVSVTGTSGCAKCHYNVAPVLNPEQLGYAVQTTDGRIAVIERMKTDYPDLYRNRFLNQRVNVQGRVIRESGRYVWIDPVRVERL